MTGTAQHPMGRQGRLRKVPLVTSSHFTLQLYVIMPIKHALAGSLPEATMLNAIYAGVFGVPTSLTYHCPSGNCTWPDFSSLSLCTQCRNGTGQRFRNETEFSRTLNQQAIYISPSNISWTSPYPKEPRTSNYGCHQPSENLSSVAGIKYRDKVFQSSAKPWCRCRTASHGMRSLLLCSGIPRQREEQLARSKGSLIVL